jgi:hypothetical protein
MLPAMTDGPVLVMVDPATTAKEVAVPRPTVVVAADAAGMAKAATVQKHTALTANAPESEFRRR